MASALNENILLAAETLEALAFSVHDLNDALAENLAQIRSNLSRMNRS